MHALVDLGRPGRALDVQLVEHATDAGLQVAGDVLVVELQRLASSNVTVVPTQGRLKPVPASWHNELHPAKAGFDIMADAFAGVLRKLFPGRL